jgi:hypothetical protein
MQDLPSITLYVENCCRGLIQSRVQVLGNGPAGPARRVGMTAEGSPAPHRASWPGSEGHRLFSRSALEDPESGVGWPVREGGA